MHWLDLRGNIIARESTPRMTNPGRVVYTAHNRGVVARWQLRNDGRFPSVRRRPATVKNIELLGLLVMIPTDDCLFSQLSLEAIKAPGPLCSSRVGLANALGILYGGAPSSGPMARIITLFVPVP